MDSFFKFISKPINFAILLSFFVTSAILVSMNFWSTETLRRLNMINFLNEFTGYLMVTLFLSLFLIVFQVSAMIITKRKDKVVNEKIEKWRIDAVNDPHCWTILYRLYKNEGNPVKLPINNRHVISLTNLEMIVRVGTQVYVQSQDELENPRFPYVLQAFGQDLVEKKINGEL
ncbi:hypothetical protein GCM10008929_17590 [Alkalibacterium psychrotolerans]